MLQALSDMSAKRDKMLVLKVGEVDGCDNLSAPFHHSV
jgi:hypothetical protein